MSDTEKNYKVWEPANIYPTAYIGEGTVIGMFAEIGDGVVIGKNCKIGGGAFIPKGVVIQDDVFIGPRACFTNDKHPSAKGHWLPLYTYVMKGASIGANATILPGITIFPNARVGAGAVVTKDVLAGQTVVGNPARAIIKI